MKTMTCNQLGGACDLKFHAETFDEIAKLSKAHGTEMFQKDDEDHLKAMNDMMELMKTPAK
jgi:predicted small metal-binding protein